MATMRKSLHAQPVFALAAATLLCASGCSSSSGSADRELFESVDDLAVHSTVVARGQVGADLTSETDETGTRLTFFRLEQPEVLGGQLASEPLAVLSYEGSPEGGYGGPDLATGEDVVLFLVAVDSAEDDTIDSQESWYQVVGGDQGVFLVDGDDVRPRLDAEDRMLPDSLADLTAEVAAADVGSRVGQVG
jgi:hypothetical protein